MKPQFDIPVRSWTGQRDSWPQTGRHILASYDDTSIVVYQAYRPEIADWALENQRFGGPWSFSRMSWIKPNFLWMMYRAGWATKPGQERILGVRIRLEAFERILATCLEASAPPGETTQCWREKLAASDVRLQWDPDHGPGGEKLERRAIQLGLRGPTLRSYATDWLVSISDATPFVHEQLALIQDGRTSSIRTPIERVYVPTTHGTREHIRLA